ncbi:MAG: arsenate reductase ArsC [bacterium]
MPDEKPTVLFLCTANTCRSQMAEGFLRHHAGDRYEAASAGTEPGEEVHPLAVRVMAEKGIDISGSRPKGFRQFLGRGRIPYAITVCDNAAESCPSVWPGLGERLHWPLPDPAAAEGSEEERLAAFRRVRDELESLILAWPGARS